MRRNPKETPVEDLRPRCLSHGGCDCREDVHDVDAVEPMGAGYAAVKIHTRLCASCRHTYKVTKDYGPTRERGSVVR